MKIAKTQAHVASGGEGRVEKRIENGREPVAFKGLVDRNGLIERLDEVNDGLLAMVRAPAGYGKTTVLQAHFQGKQASGTPAHWLTLSTAYQDAYTLYAWLIQAIRAGDSPASPVPLTSKALNCEAMVAHITATLGARTDDLYLYLDELDSILGSESARLLSLLVAQGPQRVHLLCACRARPDIPVARLRQRGLLVELGSEDLRFSREEVVALLSGGTEHVDDLIIDRLCEQSQGWVGALVLVKQALRKSPSSERLAEMLTGEHMALHDFFLEEVMPDRTLDPELFEFLLKTAALDRMCAELVTAVTGRENAGEKLQLAEAKGLFIQALDEKRTWYRYHPLFASFLRRKLADLRPNEQAQVHARASQWFFKHTDIVPAFDHALAAGDPVRAAEILDLNRPGISGGSTS